MPDDNRERRQADAAALLEKILPYDKVDAEGRMRAVHNELMFSIEKTVNEQEPHGCRFNAAEIEVLRSIALQVVYLLDPIHRAKRGFLKGIWYEFREQPRLKQATIIAAIIVTLAGAGWTLYTAFLRPQPNFQANMHLKPTASPDVLKGSK